MKTIGAMRDYALENTPFGLSEGDDKIYLSFDQSADVSVLLAALKLSQFNLLLAFAGTCYAYTDKSRRVDSLLRECRESGVFHVAHEEYKAIYRAAYERYISDPRMSEDEFHASYMSLYTMRDEKYAVEWQNFKAALRTPLLEWLEELL